jgi:hypothetical protein
MVSLRGRHPERSGAESAVQSKDRPKQSALKQEIASQGDASHAQRTGRLAPLTKSRSSCGRTLSSQHLHLTQVQV